MIGVIGRLAGIALLAYTGICTYMYLVQDDLLYYPTPEVTSDLAHDVRLSHDGEILKIWRLGDGRNAILYFGGNGENVAGNVPRFAGAFGDTAVYFMNYRGYGGSSGTPAEDALYRDAAFLFDYVRERHAAAAVIGRSLGSGVAVWLAANRPVSALVLVTPFDSVEQVARDAYPFLPVSLLLKDRYASVDRAPDIDVPVLILMAADDTVIPNRNTRALASAFSPDLLEFETIGGVGHNTISSSPRYMQQLSAFVERHNTESRQRGGTSFSR